MHRPIRAYFPVSQSAANPTSQLCSPAAGLCWHEAAEPKVDNGIFPSDTLGAYGEWRRTTAAADVMSDWGRRARNGKTRGMLWRFSISLGRDPLGIETIVTPGVAEIACCGALSLSSLTRPDFSWLSGMGMQKAFPASHGTDLWESLAASAWLSMPCCLR